MTQDLYNFNDFFTSALTFLKKHQWIYNYPNTHILHNKVLDEIPYEWHSHLNNITNDELNNLPFGAINENWPESLKAFIQEIQSLSYDTEHRLCSGLPDLAANVHLSAKKAHEIICLATVIDDMCSNLNLNCIVDVGAGLGYLSYLLHEKYHYNILAIEGNDLMYDLALQNQEQYHSSSKPHVKYLKHYVTTKSAEYIRNALIQNFKDCIESGVCIIGLHACADLSVTILEIFREIDFGKCIIIMPCCYHRLEVLHTVGSISKEKFVNFPVSNTLQVIYKNLKGWKFLRRYFLRLACQQTKNSWKNMTEKQHMEHAMSCMFRSIIQEAAEEGNLKVKRLKRKTIKLKSDSSQDNIIQRLINNIQHTHRLLPKQGNSDKTVDYTKFGDCLLMKWNKNKENCKLIEVLTAFQTAIQNVCENIILLDRVCFMREMGLMCMLYKITDDTISPRCHALVATKDTCSH